MTKENRGSFIYIDIDNDVNRNSSDKSSQVNNMIG